MLPETEAELPAAFWMPPERNLPANWPWTSPLPGALGQASGDEGAPAQPRQRKDEETWSGVRARGHRVTFPGR